MKCLAHRLQKIMLRRYMPDGYALFAIVDQRQHAVIGSNKAMPVRRKNNRTPRRPYAGIDNHHMNRFRREVRVSLRDSQRAIQNVERLHCVADVNNLRLGSDPQNHSFHGANEMFVKSKISGESNDRNPRQ